jgi:hypothetical protein
MNYEYYNMLIESLRLISAEPEIQIKSLPECVIVPDEIALIFSDTFLLIKQNKSDIAIDDFKFKRLLEIDNYLKEMSEEENKIWTIDALRINEKWERLREMVSEVLELFNKKKERPNLYWLEYID